MKNQTVKQLLFYTALAVFMLMAAFGCKKENSVTPATALKIGDTYQGGIIAYVLQPGDPGYQQDTQHGIIAKASDLGSTAKWYVNNYVVTGATGIALGTGSDNSQAIGNKQGAGNYAATNCLLIVDNYSDWYLPSLDELNKLYLSKKAIGGFKDDFYWTSTEKDSKNAFYQNFTNGYQAADTKSATYNVRAIRSF